MLGFLKTFFFFYSQSASHLTSWLYLTDEGMIDSFYNLLSIQTSYLLLMSYSHHDEMLVYLLLPFYFFLVGEVGFEPTFSTTATGMHLIRMHWYSPICETVRIRTYLTPPIQPLFTCGGFCRCCYRLFYSVDQTGLEPVNPKEEIYSLPTLPLCY